MTIDKLKQLNGYSFECNISKDMLKSDWCDQWGTAFIRFGKNQDHGAEYHLCFEKENKEYSYDCSCIYKMYRDFLHDIATDYNTFTHYKIDVNDSDWMEKLENAMCKAVIAFFFADKK